MAFNLEWIRPTEKVLTAEQVKRLEPGAYVTEIFADRHGECCRMDAKVVQYGKKKMLAYFDRVSWRNDLKPIRDSENRRYVIKKGVTE